MHVPPLSHDSISQSLILLLHAVPSKPVPVQLQVNEFIPSVHWPSFLHGFGEQSSILLLHAGPSYPGAQEQVNTKFMLIFEL